MFGVVICWLARALTYICLCNHCHQEKLQAEREARAREFRESSAKEREAKIVKKAQFLTDDAYLKQRCVRTMS